MALVAENFGQNFWGCCDEYLNDFVGGNDGNLGEMLPKFLKYIYILWQKILLGKLHILKTSKFENLGKLCFKNFLENYYFEKVWNLWKFVFLEFL